MKNSTEAKKVVFFGSSRFSVPSLKVFLSDLRFNVVAIVTSEDKPTNRGHKIMQNIVAEEAINAGYDQSKIIKIKTLRDQETANKILSLDFDLGIVVSFGFIITENIINYPKFGLINLHPASLPLFRGAAPIQRTIEQDLSFDICIIEVVKGLDSGDILLQKRYEKKNSESALDLIPKFAEEGALMLRDCALDIENYLKNKKKQVGEAGYAKKIDPSELKINFDEDGVKIWNKIKAFNMDGCSYFFGSGERIKVIEANFVPVNHDQKIPSIEGEKIYVKGGILELIRIQREGKKVMNARDVFMGFKIENLS